MNTIEDYLDSIAWAYIVAYFWPYYVIGNVDEWKELSDFYNPFI